MTSEGMDAELKRLEDIVTEMESGKLDMDRALARFEEGIAIARKVSNSIKKAELQVKLATEQGLRDFNGQEAK